MTRRKVTRWREVSSLFEASGHAARLRYRLRYRSISLLRASPLGLVFAVAGCGAPSSPSAPGDLDAAAAGEQASGARIVGAPTAGSLPLAFTLDVSGSGSASLGGIALARGAGAIAMQGRAMDAAVVARVDFAGSEVYQVIAVSKERWALVWLYCKGGALQSIYSESTDGAGISNELASGSCIERRGASVVDIRFPGFDMPAPRLPPGFSIRGEEVAYDGKGAGTIRLQGKSVALYPFSVVDCTRDCGDYKWYELHSLLWDAESQRASFGILYLYEERAWPIELAYTLTLPTLGRYGDTLAFTGASWSRD